MAGKAEKSLYAGIGGKEIFSGNQKLLEACSRAMPLLSKDFAVYLRQAHFTLNETPVSVNTHTHTYFELGISIKNDVCYSFDGFEKVIDDSLKTGILIPAGIPHCRSTSVDNTLCFGLIIDFQSTSDFAMRRFLLELREREYVIELNDQAPVIFKEIFEMCFSPYCSLQYNALNLKLLLAIIEVLRHNASAFFTESREKAKINELLYIIEQQLENNLCAYNVIDLIQRQCGVSKRHINRVFAQKYNMPIKHYIICERLKLASRLLLNTNDSVKKVALDCGFWNVSYFERQFKRTYNVPPSVYRQKG